MVCGLRKSDKAGKRVDATTEQRRLVRNIERQTRGHLNFSGRQYKLVVDVDVARVPGRNSYEVAGRDEALRVLDGLAKEAGVASDLGTLLAQASASSPLAPAAPARRADPLAPNCYRPRTGRGPRPCPDSVADAQSHADVDRRRGRR